MRHNSKAMNRWGSFISLGLFVVAANIYAQSPANAKASLQSGHLKHVNWHAGSAGESGEIQYKGRYSNPNYGFSVSIPGQLEGTSPSPPLPQHGIRVMLSATQAEAHVWVSGSYNSAEYPSLQEAANATLSYLKKDSADLQVVEQRPTVLGGLKSVRLIVKYISKTSGDLLIWDELIALRRRKEETGIVYEMGLITTESRYSIDKKTFDDMIKSWRLHPLPK
jgi:hypothetical protein